MATATMSSNAATTSSASAPEIHSRHTMASNGLIPSSSLDAILASSPRHASPDTLALTSSPNFADLPSSGSNTEPSTEPDPQIIEALGSKDRLYVLKLGEQMEGLISERGMRITLSPSTTYQRMLVHRCSAYYKLQPEADTATKGIAVYYRTESRIPTRRICELVPLEEAAQPTIKIMRRSTNEAPKSRQNSQAGSVAGEEADSSDVDEAGSIVSVRSGRSAATGGSAKRHPTLEEREAAYNEARSRIFMGFEEKEKEKEKDMSANSSTFSLVSGSASTSGGERGSSIGDLDDSVSSAATESEWSGPVTRDKRDGRRGGSAGSSSRSLRSSNTSYQANGSGSSRDSRATSPSFTYASIYEPPPAEVPYGAAPTGYMPPYMYPYGPAPGHMPTSPPYGYPYYMPYGYQPPPPDPSNPPANEAMYPPQNPPPHMGYLPPYGWSQAPQAQAYPPPPASQPQSPGNGGLTLPPHAPQSSSPQQQNVPPPPPPYANYFTPHQYNPYATYPPPMAYQPPGQYPPPPSQLYVPDMTANGSGYMNGGGSGTGSSNHSRASSRSSHHGTNKRGAPRARASWSYGPGAGNNGYTYNLSSIGNGMGASETVGPRLSSSTRRISATSSASGSAGVRTPGDEASSTTSSSTTSSRTTYTSTSSKHPLPPRPDWAVGLKAEPVLHARHHHDHSNANSRNMSPARLGGQNQHQSQPVLQPNDFPPLSSAPERRTPAVAGAWTNASSTRSIIMAGAQGNPAPQGTALVHYPNSQQPSGTPLVEAHEPGFDRPPPKVSAELFNPKGTPRMSAPARMGSGETEDTPKQKGMGQGDAACVDALAQKVASISLEECPAEVEGALAAAQNGVSAPSSAAGAEGPENAGGS
ncbi:uncharacterized protein C8Q71DRAFT_743804 [Rhodofomes roseus]|uniref:SUZ domain-containing protein n=1 Tax=Rhodofomes roseus TaxID=34475 RepID=A0ABQ8KNA2_9APHY|nr:uncharacterized protein C8Q71DRAFT_743804 [Rhodofomes roseus]KAH9839694.1 hypothetical protein C8Q71DRAFT_743804 [Rhodofomes roseus]